MKNIFDDNLKPIDFRMMNLRNSFIDTAKRSRKCHMCKCTIKAKERHMAQLHTSRWTFWQARTNVCFICLELILSHIKEPLKGKIKERRREHNAEIVLRNI